MNDRSLLLRAIPFFFVAPVPPLAIIAVIISRVPQPPFPLCRWATCRPPAAVALTSRCLGHAVATLCGTSPKGHGCSSSIPSPPPTPSNADKNTGRGRLCGKNPHPKTPQTLILHKAKSKMMFNVYWPALSLIYSIAGTTLLQSEES